MKKRFEIGEIDKLSGEWGIYQPDATPGRKMPYICRGPEGKRNASNLAWILNALGEDPIETIRAARKALDKVNRMYVPYTDIIRALDLLEGA